MFDAPPPPQTVALWRCVACGAMGASAECRGGCDFQRLRAVDAALYADLWESGEAEGALFEACAALLAALSAGDAQTLERRYPDLRAAARAALAGPEAPSAPLLDDDDVFEVWRCATCGEAEAPQECLGVCVHPVRDYVREEDWRDLAARVDAARARAQALRGLLRQIAQTTPRAGQWPRAAAYFAAAAAAMRGEGVVEA